MEMTPTPTPDTPQTSSRRERALQTRQKGRETTLMVLLPITFLFGLGLGWLLWGLSAPQAAQQAQQAEKTRYEVSVDDDPVLGPADAPVTIVEFSDYECPYCVRWYQQVYARLIKEYEGKIRFVYRDFPLTSIHPNAAPAALAANCAGEQNAYFAFHDALFGGNYGLGEDAYIQYATDLGLDVASFTTCLSENRYAAEIEADIRDAYEVGVTSTPSFYINGIAVIGAQPYEVFKQYIDAELAAQGN